MKLSGVGAIILAKMRNKKTHQSSSPMEIKTSNTAHTALASTNEQYSQSMKKNSSLSRRGRSFRKSASKKNLKRNESNPDLSAKAPDLARSQKRVEKGALQILKPQNTKPWAAKRDLYNKTIRQANREFELAYKKELEMKMKEPSSEPFKKIPEGKPRSLEPSKTADWNDEEIPDLKAGSLDSRDLPPLPDPFED